MSFCQNEKGTSALAEHSAVHLSQEDRHICPLEINISSWLQWGKVM